MTPFRPPIITPPRTASITPRQAQILVGICMGHSNSTISRNLFITEDTAKTHVRHLLRALDARDRAHAAALAMSGQVQIDVREPVKKWSTA